MDRQFVEQVKEASDIVAIMTERGIKLKRAGSRMVALCPFHREKTPSFSVNPDLGLYYCFGCGASGDVIKFVMEFDGLDFKDAIKLLAERAGIPMPQQAFSETGNKLLQLTEFAMKFYHQALLSDPQGAKAMQYLKARGLSIESIKRFALGYAPEGNALLKAAHEAAFGVDQLAAAGLVSRNSSGQWFDFFRNRLMFPVFSPTGRNIIGFSARALDDSQPKYLNSPETQLFKKSHLLYGFHVARKNIRKTGQALLVEGNMDVILAHQAGFDTAVAPLGTAFTQEQASVLAKVCEKILIVFDGDNAGLNAAKRALGPALSAGLMVRFGLLPKGEDPASLITSGKKSQLESMMLNSVDVVEFVARSFHRTSDTEEILRDLTGVLGHIRDQDVLDLYLKRVQQVLGLSQAGIEVLKQRILEGLPQPGSADQSIGLANKELFVVANGVVRSKQEPFASKMAFLQVSDLSNAEAKKVLEHFRKNSGLDGLDQETAGKIHRIVVESSLSQQELARVFVPLVWEIKLRGLASAMRQRSKQAEALGPIMIKKELAKSLYDMWRRAANIKKTAFPKRWEAVLTLLAQVDTQVQELWDQEQELSGAYHALRSDIARLYEMFDRFNDTSADELFKLEKEGDSVHG